MRIDDGAIVIGGADSVDEMQELASRANRGKKPEKPVEKKAPTEPKQDFSEPVVIGGDAFDAAQELTARREAENKAEEKTAVPQSEPQPVKTEPEEIVVGGADNAEKESAESQETAKEAPDTAECSDESLAQEPVEADKAEEPAPQSADDQEEAGEPTPEPDKKLPESAAVIRPRDMEAVRAAKAAASVPGEDASSGTGEQDFRKEFLVTASPHIHLGETTRILMQDVLIALTPAAIMSVIYFGWRAAMIIAVCIASCVLTEYVSRRIMKRRQTINDWSAVVTGMILAFCLPPEINPLFAVIGSIVAIGVVKQMFGGIGMNFANPAATARIVMMLSFPVAMTTFSRPFYYYLDAASSATPLAVLGGTGQGEMPSLLELFLGYHSGCLGETCAVALLLGGGYLLLRRVISWHIPVSFMATVMVIALIAGENPLVHLLSGGVVLGAVFMATDYVTSPINKKGQLIFGFGCGLLTMAIRLFGAMAEGVSFAILLMNIIAPHIERMTMPKPFGEERDAA